MAAALPVSDAAARADREEQFALAAEIIKAADFCLVATGAGFSADSGLPVYKDIADVPAYRAQELSYDDLCQPHWIQEDPEIFYGFWGKCLNDYREATTSASYRVLRRWRQQRFGDDSPARGLLGERLRSVHAAQDAQAETPDAVPAVPSTPFFLYTSNVDAHLRRSFAAAELYEIHGNVETWQCARPCSSALWPAPADWRFDVDAASMRVRAPAEAPAPGEWSAHPRCLNCGGPARPHVLMFNDQQWVHNRVREEAYVRWEAAVEHLLATRPELKMVVLEVGCGTRVPSVRCETEMVVRDINSRSAESGRDDQATLIRINPSPAECVSELESALCIQARGAPALLKIDALLSRA